MVDWITKNPVTEGRNAKFREQANTLNTIFAIQDRDEAAEDRAQLRTRERQDRREAKKLDEGYRAAAALPRDKRAGALAQTPGAGKQAMQAAHVQDQYTDQHQMAADAKELRMMQQGMQALKQGNVALAQHFLGQTTANIPPAVLQNIESKRRLLEAWELASKYAAEPEKQGQVLQMMLSQGGVTANDVVREFGMPQGAGVKGDMVTGMVDGQQTHLIVPHGSTQARPVTGPDGNPLRKPVSNPAIKNREGTGTGYFHAVEGEAPMAYSYQFIVDNAGKLDVLRNPKTGFPIIDFGESGIPAEFPMDRFRQHIAETLGGPEYNAPDLGGVAGQAPSSAAPTPSSVQPQHPAAQAAATTPAQPTSVAPAPDRPGGSAETAISMSQEEFMSRAQATQAKGGTIPIGVFFNVAGVTVVSYLDETSTPPRISFKPYNPADAAE